MKRLITATVAMMCLVATSGCKEDSPSKDSSAAATSDAKAAKDVKKEQPKAKAAGPTKPAAAEPAAAEPAAAEPAAADPNALNKHGLPVTIPEPGSKVPTLAEWNAVTREITVRGSSALNCETKMLREWLRVSCRKNAEHGEPSKVETFASGQQHFQFPAAGVAASGVTSVVVQVVRRKNFSAKFSWADNHVATLKLSWPHGAPNPTITLQ